MNSAQDVRPRPARRSGYARNGGLTLMLLAIVLAAPSGARAEALTESDRLVQMSMEDLLNLKISSVSKTAESLRHTPMSVYVVSAEEMERWGLRGLYEVFQRVPGYSFYNTDFYGQYGAIGRGLQSVWRYGFSFELMNVVDFGHFEFTPHFFKSVEIARGPAGLTWGSGAEAGLVNFNVRDDLNGLAAVAELGTYKSRSLDLMYGKRLDGGGRQIFLGTHLEAQDARIQHNAFDDPGRIWKENGIRPSQCLLAKLDYSPLKFILFTDHADHIAPRLWFGPDSLQAALEVFQKDAHDQLEVLAYRAEYHLTALPRKVQAYLYHDYYRKQWWTESVALDTQRRRSLGFSSTASLWQDRLELNCGGDYWGEEQTTAPSFTSEWANSRYGINWYDTALSPVKNSWANVYVQGVIVPRENVRLLLGGRVDHTRQAKEPTLFTGPRVGLFYDLTPGLTLKYLYNDAKRGPQANERVSPVDAEKLRAHELVAMYEGKTLQCDVTLYNQRLRDQITRQNNPALLNAFTNTGGLKTWGVEWSAKEMPDDRVLLYWNGSWQHAEVLQGLDQSGNEITDPHNAQGRPLFVPRLTTFAGAEVLLHGLVYLNGAVRVIQDIPYRNAELQEKRTSVSFLDGSIRTKKFANGRLALSAACLNVLDNDHRVPAYGEHSGNAPGTLEPENRRLYLRASYEF